MDIEIQKLLKNQPDKSRVMSINYDDSLSQIIVCSQREMVMKPGKLFVV